MIDCDCFILCNVMMECFMMCNELHRCMHYAHNLPFESCKNGCQFTVTESSSRTVQ
ncbi:hypothetical protein OPT817_60 [Klebsiella phage vB_KpnD_Opt-817]|uniref:Uncharacterized protein n=1 Tax=Klebsiella phage vB_KpnD_Opt-817 TaxID=2902680 RepID=A0AC61TPV2_9CAUD|nr:hypothetical protein OPT817_60 [Klebsiella phage vB_KpnD_Opt-817]